MKTKYLPMAMLIFIIFSIVCFANEREVKILTQKNLMVTDIFTLENNFDTTESINWEKYTYPFHVLKTTSKSITGQIMYEKEIEPHTRELVISSSDSRIEKILLDIVPAKFDAIAPKNWTGNAYDGGIHLKRKEVVHTFEVNNRKGETIINAEVNVRFVDDPNHPYKNKSDIYKDLSNKKGERFKTYSNRPEETIVPIIFEDFSGYAYVRTGEKSVRGYAGGAGLYSAEYFDYTEGYVVKGHQVIYIYIKSSGYSDYTNVDLNYLIEASKRAMKEAVAIFETIHLSPDGMRHIGTPPNFEGTSSENSDTHSNENSLNNGSKVNDEAKPYMITMSQQTVEQNFNYYLPGFDSSRKSLTYEKGIMKIDIDSGNGWPKTGIHSSLPFVKITEDMSDNPLVIHFDIIPEMSKGFKICFSKKNGDSLLYQNESIHIFYRKQVDGTKTGLSLYNPVAESNNVYKSWDGFKMPERITLKIYTNRIVVEDSLNNKLERPLEFVKNNDGLYLYVFACPDKRSGECGIALKNITIERGSNKLDIKPISYPSVSETVLFTDKFNILDENKWVKVKDTDGDFDSYYKIVDGVLDIDIPAGKEWAKAGIRTKEKLFEVPPSDEKRIIDIKLQANNFHSYCLMLYSQGLNSHFWGADNVRYVFEVHPLQQINYVALANSAQYDNKIVKYLRPNYSMADNRVVLEVSIGKVKVYTSWGDVFEKEFEWLKEGTPVYLHMYTHAYDRNLPAHLAVESITVY